MSQICVLGAGMVGQAIARDLGPRHDVTSVDRDAEALAGLAAEGVTTRVADLSEPGRVAGLLGDCDLAVSAVPGFMGFQTLRAIVAAGKPVVDISFMPEDATALDHLARDQGVTAVVDMGVAPGMDNLILGHHDRLMQVSRFECLVGGLPKRRSYPFEYKAPFSPIDVIEEYTRPARYVEHGQIVTRPALSEPELVDFREIGTLEAFNTDGLRSLIASMRHIPDMKEKTLRYPGHRDLMAALQAGGFFSDREITLGGRALRPVDFSAAILMEAWKLAGDEKEFTVMRITIEGEEQGEALSYVYDLFDEYDEKTRTSSMARTTGYACTAVAEILLSGAYSATGISPPELLGREPDCLDKVMRYLADRNVRYEITRVVAG